MARNCKAAIASLIWTTFPGHFRLGATYITRNRSHVIFSRACVDFYGWWKRNSFPVPVTAHVPNFDFLTGYCDFKKCEESKRALKNPFASCLAKFITTLKLLRITEQWHFFPVKFQFGRIGSFWCCFHCLWLEDWEKGSSLMQIEGLFLLPGDNHERNKQKWNSNNKDYCKSSIKPPRGLIFFKHCWGGLI